MLTGSLVALVTPFDEQGQVDDAALERLIEFHVSEGSDGLVIAGTTGESPTLTATEHAALIRRATDITGGRLPVIGGTGSNSTRQTIELSQEIADCPLDAYLLVVPYYNKPAQAGLVAHFTAIADAIDKPAILYNVPGRTVADLEPETLAELAQHPNIVGIKDATGDMARMQANKALVASHFGYYSGDDFTTLEFLELGGHGVITVSGNVVPARVAELCRLALAGEVEEARVLDATLQPLNSALFAESNPIPVKWALARMGLISPSIRLPLTEYAEKYHAQMIDALNTAGVSPGEAA